MNNPKVGQVLNGDTVVYIHHPFYMLEISRSMDDMKLYAVHKISNYWRDVKYARYYNVDKDKALAWIEEHVK